MNGLQFTLLLICQVTLGKSINISNVNNQDEVGGSNNASNNAPEASEFPEDLFTELERKQGAIILHCILAAYCFLAIARVCTEFFMPTIERICQVLNLSDDVAAATFMSIATSSPELFTNIIGTFVTDSDIGIGHILGNAYYNMFFVVFLGGIAASKNIVLDWWPIARDCTIYLVVSITLTGIVWDGEVKLHETLLLLTLYVLYFIVMFANHAIIRLLEKFNVNIEDPVQEHKNDTFYANEKGNGNTELKNDQNHENYMMVPTAESNPDKIVPLPEESINQLDDQGEKRNYCEILGKLLLLPLNIATAMTIPDVRKAKYQYLYPVSFLMCVCWIGVSTYLGTWMISVIGATAGVPDIIMGMVFMAAGGSVVEAYGVCYKTRRGECSIGLSNSMGCNTLDATMCLGLPWLIKIALNGGTSILLASKVLHINCGLAIISVLSIFTLLYITKFTLNWKTGICSGVAYAIVLTIAVYVEASQ